MGIIMSTTRRIKKKITAAELKKFDDELQNLIVTVEKPEVRFLPFANTRFNVADTPKTKDVLDSLKQTRANHGCVRIINGKLGVINEARQASVLQDTTFWPVAKTTPAKKTAFSRFFHDLKNVQSNKRLANAGLLFFHKNNSTSEQKVKFKTSRIRQKNK